MARDHARMYLSVWEDPEWRDLDESAQNTYWKILGQKRLSYCGVLDYFPGRLATQTKGQSEARVRAAVRRLERSRFVILDDATHELLVRTYVRHDGVLDRNNMGKATARAVNNIVSAKIRDAVLTELGRVKAEKPTLMGWVGFKELAPDAYEMACAMASTIPLPMASGGDR